jgi:hypothetical protein
MMRPGTIHCSRAVSIIITAITCICVLTAFPALGLDWHLRVSPEELDRLSGGNGGKIQGWFLCDEFSKLSPCTQVGTGNCLTCGVKWFKDQGLVAGEYLRGEPGKGNCGDKFLGNCVQDSQSGQLVCVKTTSLEPFERCDQPHSEPIKQKDVGDP